MATQVKPKNYHVVLEGTGTPESNHAGIRTIVSFEDAADFQRWQQDTQNADRVIAQGISYDQAYELAASMSPQDLVASLQDFSPEQRDLEIANMLFVAEIEGTKVELVMALIDAGYMSWQK